VQAAIAFEVRVGRRRIASTLTVTTSTDAALAILSSKS